MLAIIPRLIADGVTSQLKDLLDKGLS